VEQPALALISCVGYSFLLMHHEFIKQASIRSGTFEDFEHTCARDVVYLQVRAQGIELPMLRWHNTKMGKNLLLL
jgi:hypothetical protein